jgi:MFS family permease
LLPLFVVAHFGQHLLTALLVPLLPFIRDEFALDYAQAGWVVAAFTLSYGIAQLPAGWLADRIGSRALITVGISGVAVSGLLLGTSPTHIAMVVFLVLLGITGGGYHPASVPLISTSVEPKDRGRALGIHQMGGTGSYFLAPLIAVGIAAAVGWRGAFIGLAIPILAFGIVFYVLLDRQGRPNKADDGIPHSHFEPPSRPARLARLVPLLTLSITGSVLIFSTLSFIPLFIVDHFGGSEQAGAALLALAYSAGFWAAPLGGYLSDRLGTTVVVLVASLAIGPIFYLLSVASYGWRISAVLLALGVSLYLRMPATEAYLISQTSQRNRSTILGIYYFGGNEGQGVITPTIGYLIDRFGFSTSFTIVGAAIMAITLGCGLFLRGRRNWPSLQ